MVPTRIILVIAPINAALNYLLGPYRPSLVILDVDRPE